jgi:Flp pilus assembly protein TadG
MSHKHVYRKRGESGNSLIETALIFVPLFAILFALFDFSMPIFLRSTLQSAVRAGVRYAVTYQTAPGFGQDDSIRQVVQQNALGFVDGAAGAAKIFVKYYAPANLSAEVTGVGSNGPGNVVEISVQNYMWGWVAPLSGTITQPLYATSALAISVSSADRMEGLPAGQISPPAR